MYSKIKYGTIEVSYLWGLNGGGIIFAHEYVRVVSQKMGKVGHIFEYCAGPGFIGFALLAQGLCERLTLADVNPQAVAAIQETIKNNHLEDKVKVYQSDCLDAIPETEKWDLVVGNPPWWLCKEDRKNIRVCDPKGIVHEKFFKDIQKFLNPQASILLVEGGEYTNPWHFQEMIKRNSLQMKSAFNAVYLKDFFKGLGEYPGLNGAYIIFLRLCLFVREVYFIWIIEKSDTVKLGSMSPQALQIIRKRKALMWAYGGMLLSYSVIFTPLGSLPVFIFWLWSMFLVLHLAMALEKKRPEFYFFAMLLPVVKLIVPLILFWSARKVKTA